MPRLLSADGILLVESAVLLLLVRLALLVYPFGTLLRVVNNVAGSARVRGRKPRTIERVRRAVLKASRYIPGSRHCLTQALVAKTLLGNQSRAIDVRIGVAKDEAGRLIAHAWLEAEGKPIFGVTESQLDRYSRLPQFDRV